MSYIPVTRMTAIFLGILLCVTGCAVKMPPVSTYVLTTPTVMASKAPAQTHYVLLVDPMRADPGYKTSSMIYLTNPGHLREFSRNAWVAPPAQLMMPLMVGHIESKHYFRAVVMQPFTGNTDFRLDTRLVILQQEFIQPVSQVRCVVHAVLTNAKTNQVIASRQFQALVPAPCNNPPSGAAAANQAANLVSEQLAQFVVANISKK